MATTTHDDGFHEIQLNGKQLVFLFMAVTVVSVVIFLSGVLVGRGVRMDRGGSIAGVADASAPGESAVPPPADSPNTPITSEKDLVAQNMLGTNPPADGKLTPVEEPPVRTEQVPDSPPPAAAPPAPAAAPPAAKTPEPKAAAAPQETVAKPAAAAAPPAPTGPGIEIQLSAFRDRKGADALANRLLAMGFPAYVVPPGAGAPALFRVRVGKFKERREADTAAAKLKKEKFTPWILP
jgi:cell division septation protein DedD